VTSSDENPDHSFTTPGTYTVTLTVTAQDGEQGSTSQTITVDPS
jgi:surface-anchored protein